MSLAEKIRHAAMLMSERREFQMTLHRDEWMLIYEALRTPAPEAPASDVLAQVEAALRKNPLIAMFLDQQFWHAHHVDIVIRHDGQDRRYEADWIKDIWYIVRRRGLSATQAVRAEQTESLPQNERG